MFVAVSYLLLDLHYATQHNSPSAALWALGWRRLGDDGGRSDTGRGR